MDWFRQNFEVCCCVESGQLAEKYCMITNGMESIHPNTQRIGRSSEKMKEIGVAEIAI